MKILITEVWISDFLLYLYTSPDRVTESWAGLGTRLVLIYFPRQSDGKLGGPGNEASTYILSQTERRKAGRAWERG